MQLSPRSTSFSCNDNENNTLTGKKEIWTRIRILIKYINAKLEAYTLLEELREHIVVKLLPPMPDARSTRVDAPYQFTWSFCELDFCCAPLRPLVTVAGE